MSRKERWVAWATFGVLASALVPSFIQWPEERIQPEPFAISELGRFRRNRTELSPHLRHLIAELEAGRVLGAQAVNYRSNLDHASEFRVGKRFTTYTFSEYPETGHSEQNTELVIAVQNKFGHIISCHVGSPEY